MKKIFLNKAVELAKDNIEQGGRPFGAIVVKDNQVVAQAVNTMLKDCDPTAHAEMSALRLAGQALQSASLEGCVVYASGEPCPMCQAAMYMAGIREVYYVFSNSDAEPYQLSTATIAEEMRKLPSDRTQFHWEALSATDKQDLPHLYAIWKDTVAN